MDEAERWRQKKAALIEARDDLLRLASWKRAEIERQDPNLDHIFKSIVDDWTQVWLATLPDKPHWILSVLDLQITGDDEVTRRLAKALGNCHRLLHELHEWSRIRKWTCDGCDCGGLTDYEIHEIFYNADREKRRFHTS
jgi:hypothetical protein